MPSIWFCQHPGLLCYRQHPDGGHRLRTNSGVEEKSSVWRPTAGILRHVIGVEEFLGSCAVGVLAVEIEPALASRIENQRAPVGRPERVLFPGRIGGKAPGQTALEIVNPDICVAPEGGPYGGGLPIRRDAEAAENAGIPDIAKTISRFSIEPRQAERTRSAVG